MCWIDIHNHRKGSPALTAIAFANWLNNFLLPSFPLWKDIMVTSHQSAKNLKDLGYEYTKDSKGLYKDDHERDDVVVYRNDVYLPTIRALEQRSQMYGAHGADTSNITAPTDDSKPQVVFVFHDDSTCHANDVQSSHWIKKWDHVKKPKELGAGIMISGFVSEECGMLEMTQTQWDTYKSDVQAKGGMVTLPDLRQLKLAGGELSAQHWIKIGAKHADSFHPTGYWTNNSLVQQMPHAISVFEATHPGKIAAFVFDNSTGHNAYADDALISSRFNMNPGGKSAYRMRSTTFVTNSGLTKSQSMVFIDGDTALFDFALKLSDDGAAVNVRRGTTVSVGSSLIGVPKGLKQVLLERELFTPGMKHCCPASLTKFDTVTEIDAMNGAELKHALRKRGLFIGGKVAELRERLRTSTQSTAVAAAEAVVDNEIRPRHRGTASQPCCCTYVIDLQPDFQLQQNAIAEIVRSRGHELVFLPKFHPELNPIERVWGRMKLFRRRQCSYSFTALWTMRNEPFQQSWMSLTLVRKYFRTCWRWLAAYERGLTGLLAQYAVKRHSKHREMKESLDEIIDEVAEASARDLRAMFDV